MPLRQLIMAVLMLLSLSAQTSTAWLNCGASGSADCCNPQRQTQGCPSPGNTRLSCDQLCSTDSATGVSATLEREQQTARLDPLDGPPALPTRFFELLANADRPETSRQPVEPPETRYPTLPTYLATARLRI